MRSVATLRFRPPAVTPAAMGSLDEALLVVLSSGGAVSVLARSLTEWVKHRTSDVRLTLTRSDGETAITAATARHRLGRSCREAD